MEKHHIIPLCMKGKNNFKNVVTLTPEEHFIAHQLLVKIYPKEFKLVYALHMMAEQSYRRNNKEYGWIKKKHSEINKGENHPFHGKQHSKESRNSQSRKMKGNKNRYKDKRVIANGQIYNHYIEAAKELKVGPRTIKNRIKNPKFPDYSFLNKSMI